jgi:two-component system sensor histidine kinase ChiS
MRVKNVLLIFIFLLATTRIYNAEAQKPAISFQHLKLTDGYSESTTRFINEDSTGFIWIGTEDGLNKYDGYKFTNYKNDVANIYSLSNDDTKESFRDSKGNLWIATRSGLNLYDSQLDRFYNYRSHKYTCFKDLDGDIDYITEDEYGNIWVSAGNEGLYKISDLNQKAENFFFPSPDNAGKLYGLEADPNGTLWVGTRDGLLSFDIRTNRFTDLRPQYGSGYQIRNIFYEKETHRLWLCTTDGLKYIDQKTNVLKSYKHNPLHPASISGNNIINIVPNGQHSYLIAVDGGGMDYFDIATETFYHYTSSNEGQLSANNVTYVFKDSKNNFWVGTFMNGVDFSNPTTNMFSMVRNNPFSESALNRGIVTNFLEDRQGTLWVSTDGGGLYFRKKGHENFTAYNPHPKIYDFEQYPLLSFAQDLDGIIWIGTYGGGLVALDPLTHKIEVFRHDRQNSNSVNNNSIRNLLVDRSNNLWICGYYTGISVYDKKTKQFSHYRHNTSNPYSIASDWVQTIFMDKQGTIWLNTFKGLNRYDRGADRFKTYQFKSSEHPFISCNHLLDMTEAGDSNLWIGTMGAGLICFNPKKETYKFYTEKNALSNNTIKSLVEDNEHNLWMATNNGITKFDIFDRIATPYTIQNGVPPYSYYFTASYKDPAGKIYFGNSKGYLLIDPALSIHNQIIPPVVITNIRIGGKPLAYYRKQTDPALHVQYIQELRLQHTQNELEIEYAALNFNNPQRNSYAYRLHGFDDAWKQAGHQRYAKYTNLPPGTYTFQVKGANNDGVWNEAGTSFKIYIAPPWWKTWWCILLQIISGAGLLYSLYRLRIQRIHRKNEQLEAVVQKRTEELSTTNQQLEAFIYKASHDIKGPLRSIIGLTTVGQKDIKDPDSLVYFTHILKSTQKLDKLLADMLELTKVKEALVIKEKINFRELVNEALTKFEHMDEYERIKFQVTIDQTEDFYSDRKLLYSIIQNLIENPIKYSDPEKAESYLRIYISVDASQAQLRFSDNGIGIPENIQSKVFEMFFKASERSGDTGLGLHIVKTSVEKLNGTISLDSQPGVGSTFTVWFPN